MFTSSIKRRIRWFYVVVVQWTSKKCTKKRDARAELFFAYCCRGGGGCLSSLLTRLNTCAGCCLTSVPSVFMILLFVCRRNDALSAQLHHS